MLKVYDFLPKANLAAQSLRTPQTGQGLAFPQQLVSFGVAG
jgi:hypothetical protein